MLLLKGKLKQYRYQNERQESFHKSFELGKSKTLASWPDTTLDTHLLAKWGFFYQPTLQHRDQIQCFCCNKKLHSLKGLKEELILDKMSCNWSKLAKFTLDKDQDTNVLNNSHNEEAIQIRLSTFKDFPKSKPTALSLAQAGFIFTPLRSDDDSTTCIYCQCILDGWEKNDDPFEEHRLRNRKCEVFGTDSASDSELENEDSISDIEVQKPERDTETFLKQSQDSQQLSDDEFEENNLNIKLKNRYGSSKIRKNNLITSSSNPSSSAAEISQRISKPLQRRSWYREEPTSKRSSDQFLSDDDTSQSPPEKKLKDETYDDSSLMEISAIQESPVKVNGESVKDIINSTFSKMPSPQSSPKQSSQPLNVLPLKKSPIKLPQMSKRSNPRALPRLRNQDRTEKIVSQQGILDALSSSDTPSVPQIQLSEEVFDHHDSLMILMISEPNGVESNEPDFEPEVEHVADSIARPEVEAQKEMEPEGEHIQEVVPNNEPEAELQAEMKVDLQDYLNAESEKGSEGPDLVPKDVIEENPVPDSSPQPEVEPEAAQDLEHEEVTSKDPTQELNTKELIAEVHTELISDNKANSESNSDLEVNNDREEAEESMVELKNQKATRKPPVIEDFTLSSDDSAITSQDVEKPITKNKKDTKQNNKVLLPRRSTRLTVLSNRDLSIAEKIELENETVYADRRRTRSSMTPYLPEKPKQEEEEEHEERDDKGKKSSPMRSQKTKTKAKRKSVIKPAKVTKTKLKRGLKAKIEEDTTNRDSSGADSLSQLISNSSVKISSGSLIDSPDLSDRASRTQKRISLMKMMKERQARLLKNDNKSDEGSLKELLKLKERRRETLVVNKSPGKSPLKLNKLIDLEDSVDIFGQSSPLRSERDKLKGFGIDKIAKVIEKDIFGQSLSAQGSKLPTPTPKLEREVTPSLPPPNSVSVEPLQSQGSPPWSRQSTSQPEVLLESRDHFRVSVEDEHMENHLDDEDGDDHSLASSRSSIRIKHKNSSESLKRVSIDSVSHNRSSFLGPSLRSSLLSNDSLNKSVLNPLVKSPILSAKFEVSKIDDDVILADDDIFSGENTSKVVANQASVEDNVLSEQVPGKSDGGQLLDKKDDKERLGEEPQKQSHNEDSLELPGVIAEFQSSEEELHDEPSASKTPKISTIHEFEMIKSSTPLNIKEADAESTSLDLNTVPHTTTSSPEKTDAIQEATLTHNEVTLPAEETKELKWDPSEPTLLNQILSDIETSGEFLTKIVNSPYESLNEDLDGELTNFMAQMPDNELEMTIKEWVNHNAKQLSQLLELNLDQMLSFFKQEGKKLLEMLESLPISDEPSE